MFTMLKIGKAIFIFYVIVISFCFEDSWDQRFYRQPVIIQTKPLSPKSRLCLNLPWKEKRCEQCLCNVIFFFETSLRHIWIGFLLRTPCFNMNKICASSFYYIYNIRGIRKYLSQQSTETRPRIHNKSPWLLQWSFLWSTRLLVK